MMDFAIIDPTIDQEPDPLKLAEDRVAEAEANIAKAVRSHRTHFTEYWSEQVERRQAELDAARTDLATLQRKYEVEAEALRVTGIERARYYDHPSRAQLRVLYEAEADLAAARRDLDALRAQLAAEAGDELPYRDGDL